MSKHPLADNREMNDRAPSADRQRILIVDDEPGIRRLMRDFLEGDGFAVSEAATSSDALTALADAIHDCVLLDVMLAESDGFEVCRRIREFDEIPIVFLSARGADAEKLRAFRIGADDYVVKSATPDEVVARIRAVLRRARPRTGDSQGEVIAFGRMRLDLRAHELLVDGVPVAIPPREFALLRLLAENPRLVFTHDHLIERVWGGFAGRSTVAVHIRRLRERIETDAAEPRHLVTVRGVGYRFEPGP
jgi:DNA-binding response OmpR family regulator